MKNDVATGAREYIACSLSDENTDLFTSEAKYVVQLGLKELESVEGGLPSSSPIEDFEVIPDDYKETQPHVVILSNATIESD